MKSNKLQARKNMDKMLMEMDKMFAISERIDQLLLISLRDNFSVDRVEIIDLNKIISGILFVMQLTLPSISPLPRVFTYHSDGYNQNGKFFNFLAINMSSPKLNNLNTGMECLKRENAKLATLIENYLMEIQNQKELNSQHEVQIQTLLSFNQRLLTIIEREAFSNRRENCSLQPISQRSERSSDLFGTCTLESMIRSKKLAVKSEWGGTKDSSTNQSLFKKLPLNIFDTVSDTESWKNQKHSEIIQPEFEVEPLKKSISESILFRSEVQKGLKQLREFKDKTNTFYNKKLSQIKTLSTKLGSYHPIAEITKITEKIAVSSETMNLIKSRISKII